MKACRGAGREILPIRQALLAQDLVKFLSQCLDEKENIIQLECS